MYYQQLFKYAVGLFVACVGMISAAYAEGGTDGFRLKPFQIAQANSEQNSDVRWRKGKQNPVPESIESDESQKKRFYKEQQNRRDEKHDALREERKSRREKFRDDRKARRDSIREERQLRRERERAKIEFRNQQESKKRFERRQAERQRRLDEKRARQERARDRVYRRAETREKTQKRIEFTRDERRDIRDEERRYRKERRKEFRQLKAEERERINRRYRERWKQEKAERRKRRRAYKERLRRIDNYEKQRLRLERKRIREAFEARKARKERKVEIGRAYERIRIRKERDQNRRLKRYSRKLDEKKLRKLRRQRFIDRRGKYVEFEPRDYRFRKKRYRKLGRRKYRDGLHIYLTPPLGSYFDHRSYVLEGGDASLGDIEDALEDPIAVDIRQTYSVNDVIEDPEIRRKVRSINLDTITFSFGSSEISEEQLATLDDVAFAISKILKRRPRQVFLIEGHTDAVGSEEYNQGLSEDRAAAVKDALIIEYGIPEENLVDVGYGEEFLKVQTLDAEEENRRVAIRNISPLIHRNKVSRYR